MYILHARVCVAVSVALCQDRSEALNVGSFLGPEMSASRLPSLGSVTGDAVLNLGSLPLHTLFEQLPLNCSSFNLAVWSEILSCVAPLGGLQMQLTPPASILDLIILFSNL